MKIAQVTGDFHCKYYLSNEYFLSREFARLGHEVTVFTANKRAKWQTVENYEIENKIEKTNGFVVRRFPSGPEIGVVPLMPTLLLELLNEEIDIIHAHDFFTALSFYSAIAAKAKRVPFIVTQHNDQMPSYLINRFLYQFNSLTFGKFVLFQANKIIALSKESKRHLLQMGADENKLEVIPNAVDTERFSPNRKNLLQVKWGISPPVILFVGRLVKDKGVEYLLKAFSKVVKEIPDVKLVIVGKGPQEEELRNLQKRLGSAQVYFLGIVETEIMPNIYTGCDVIVLPSIREPFGNVVIEAMAAGKPVIGSYVGGMKDTIMHGVTGYHVQPRNAEQISNFIVRLLNDTSLKEKLGRNSREKAVADYDEAILISKIEKIYDQCAS